jgi:hypothetical protein
LNIIEVNQQQKINFCSVFALTGKILDSQSHLQDRQSNTIITKSPSQNSIGLWIIFHFIKLWHLSTTLTSTPSQIPDRLWDGTSTVLSREKPDNAVGRPIVPFRKVMGGIMHILRTGSRKTLSREHGSGSTCHRQFQELVHLDIFRKTWTGALALYDGKETVSWTWQSLDCIPIKPPFRGGMTGNTLID